MANSKRKNLLGFVYGTVRARPRMVLSILFGTLVGFLAPADVGLTQALLAWNAGALLFVVLALTMMARTDAAAIRDRSSAEEEGRLTVLTVVTAAAAMTLIAIAVEIFALKEMQGASRALRLALTFATVLISWIFVHTVFAIDYAHEYHSEIKGRKKALRGGLQFPGETMPDYWDFMYFAFTIGMTAQTSDVVITSRTMRRIVICHGLIAFVFTTAVIALTVNLGSQLVS